MPPSPTTLRLLRARLIHVSPASDLLRVEAEGVPADAAPELVLGDERIPAMPVTPGSLAVLAFRLAPGALDAEGLLPRVEAGAATAALPFPSESAPRDALAAGAVERARAELREAQAQLA